MNEVDTIIEYHERFKYMRLSRLKIEYLNYLKIMYDDLKLESIKDIARDINNMTNDNILDLFISNGYKWQGCRCNSGAILIKERV